MKSLKLVAGLSLAVLSLPAHAEKPSVYQMEEARIGALESLSISEILQSPAFAQLPKSNPMIPLLKTIERLKAEDPSLSSDDIIKMIDRGQIPWDASEFSSIRSLSSVYDQWQHLTAEEKALIATNPGKAALTYMTKDKAFELTQKHQGRNGLGDPSDAFRHGIWNALMSRYISKLWAFQFATAHEAKSEEDLEKLAADGFSEREHQAMDLHNNEQGRDCWSVLTDSILTTSDEDLVERVKEKLSNNDLIWLHS